MCAHIDPAGTPFGTVSALLSGVWSVDKSAASDWELQPPFKLSEKGKMLLDPNQRLSKGSK